MSLSEIIGEVVALKEQFKDEMLTFGVQIEKGSEYSVVAIVQDSNGATLTDIEYDQTRSQETAKAYADMILKGVSNTVDGIKVNPVLLLK